MSSKWETSDPIFAAYLISKGCKLLTVIPHRKPRPKKYHFAWSWEIIAHEAVFLGAREQRVKTTWLDFKNRMENLQDIEDAILNISSSRMKRDGIETWLGKEVFVTSSQVVAAFLLYRGAQIYRASEIKKNNYLFAFLDANGSKALAKEMLSGQVEETWYAMKEKYKLATSLRRHFCRPKKKPTQEESQGLQVSGTNG